MTGSSSEKGVPAPIEVAGAVRPSPQNRDHIKLTPDAALP
jgi:hypothetical protein